jgi:hypothetical protein
MPSSASPIDYLKQEIKKFDPSIPIAKAFTPPSSWYTDPLFLRLESKSIFHSNYIQGNPKSSTIPDNQLVEETNLKNLVTTSAALFSANHTSSFSTLTVNFAASSTFVVITLLAS